MKLAFDNTAAAPATDFTSHAPSALPEQLDAVLAGVRAREAVVVYAKTGTSREHAAAKALAERAGLYLVSDDIGLNRYSSPVIAVGTPLRHRHIMFGHAYKGQPAGRVLLQRFKAGGGTLYDLEYLVDETGRRVAAFGYWAGYAGAAVALKCWAAQQRGAIAGPVAKYAGKTALLADLLTELPETLRPRAIIIGALGRVGTGAADLCTALGVDVTKWDMAETASGGPFPQVLQHEIFLNCILARPGCPVFVPASAIDDPARKLTVIGDIACDPTSDFSPIKVYDRATDWAEPALRVATDPVLDVTAIDNLPSLLPVESSQDYATQLLPTLTALTMIEAGVWGRAKAEYLAHSADQ
jgi:saccharopine dehydrogenase (NAD+, L-lysine-forming)